MYFYSVYVDVINITPSLCSKKNAILDSREVDWFQL
jgi:hypothetical protein